MIKNFCTIVRITIFHIHIMLHWEDLICNI